MTNHWIDVKNANVVLIMGANPAENHPVAFRWILRAKDNGGKIICVDPRFTRSASKADIYAPLRPGTDIAFLGGMIRHILENKLYEEEPVRNYTNASYLVNPDFKLPGDLHGPGVVVEGMARRRAGLERPEAVAAYAAARV